MSSQYKYENQVEEVREQSKVKLTDLLSRINEEKKIERNSLNHAISDMKPPIFWKEKEIVKKQAFLWNLSDLKKKIYEINDIENVVKTNSKNSINLVSDFIVNY